MTGLAKEKTATEGATEAIGSVLSSGGESGSRGRDYSRRGGSGSGGIEIGSVGSGGRISAAADAEVTSATEATAKVSITESIAW